ncbi:MAG: phosphoribosylformylglycinamidine synthase subunit PurQ [Limnochordaceae bacterium]|nr:phosphoribosylformylglycinamidine synthase subunit PurQ [Limnochordaceae bacterium]
MSAAVVGVVTFPGTNCDRDVVHAINRAAGERAGLRAVPVWYEETDLSGIDAVVLPGGFSYGDYLRSGAIAALAPVMRAVAGRARQGMPVLGICNGFQILLEAGLLPGAMRRNRTLSFICRAVPVRVESVETPFTRAYRKGQVLWLPIAHYEGNYFAWPEELGAIEAGDEAAPGRVVLRYSGPDGQDARIFSEYNPNGAAGAIAALANPAGNVVGMMPHPERASEEWLGSTDGLGVWLSLGRWLAERRAAAGVPAGRGGAP